MMDTMHKSALETILDKAIHKAMEAMEDHSYSECKTYMCIARDADHILRKNSEGDMARR